MHYALHTLFQEMFLPNLSGVLRSFSRFLLSAGQGKSETKIHDALGLQLENIKNYKNQKLFSLRESQHSYLL